MEKVLENSVIIGIGIDLIEIERVEKACNKQHFFMRCFSIKEQEMIGNDYCKAAGNWAVKEAVSKAFGTGLVGFELNEIEVLREKSGRPFVKLHGKANEIATKLQISNIHVSITNTKEYASAYVVAEGRINDEILS